MCIDSEQLVEQICALNWMIRNYVPYGILVTHKWFGSEKLSVFDERPVATLRHLCDSLTNAICDTMDHTIKIKANVRLTNSDLGWLADHIGQQLSIGLGFIRPARRIGYKHSFMLKLLYYHQKDSVIRSLMVKRLFTNCDDHAYSVHERLISTGFVFPTRYSLLPPYEGSRLSCI